MPSSMADLPVRAGPATGTLKAALANNNMVGSLVEVVDLKGPLQGGGQGVIRHDRDRQDKR